MKETMREEMVLAATQEVRSRASERSPAAAVLVLVEVFLVRESRELVIVTGVNTLDSTRRTHK